MFSGGTEVEHWLKMGQRIITRSTGNNLVVLVTLILSYQDLLQSWTVIKNIFF